MPETKRLNRRDSKQIPAVPTRLASYTRVRSPVAGDERIAEGGTPSTLPPAPFAHETGVVGLEWWLEAHMGLAAELAWLEQLLEIGEGEAHAATLRTLTEQVEAVRDALYELYCDAADVRVTPLVAAGAGLEQHVRRTYAWCGRVVAMLGALLNGLRSEQGPDLRLAKNGFRSVQGLYPGPSDAVRAAVRSLALDTTNPTEPLRNLPRDVEGLFADTAALESALAKRFS